MTPVIIGIICLAFLFILLLMQMPIAIAMGLTGFIGSAWLLGFDQALGMLGIYPFETWSSYTLSVVPLFILMGLLLYNSGVSTDLYDAAYTWIGHVRGGLAMATVGGCAAFASVSGSSISTAVTMGMVAIPEMRKHKYDPGLMTGVVASGGTMGAMIPPSMGLIFYGIITEQSIGKLFLAGFIPGITEAIFYIATIYLLCTLRPNMGPPGPYTTLREKGKSLKKTFPIFCLFLLVIGGIYFGVFSPTEAGGIGAFGAFMYAIITGNLARPLFLESLRSTTKVVAMVLLILTGASMLNIFMAVSRLPTELSDFVGSLPLNRYIILTFILFFYLVLGCFMDPLSMMLLTLPVFFPLIIAMDFNPIWFGILVTRMGEIANITPPLGMTLFVIKGIAKDIHMQTVVRGIVPFIVADILHLILLIVFPQISLFLPGMMSH
ncbi:MAG: TRAP transporter large permease [Deltaproteobacteria bacterium]|nr:TRAP transporter large permease [Deltaproteobacteria bacterium]